MSLPLLIDQLLYHRNMHNDKVQPMRSLHVGLSIVVSQLQHFGFKKYGYLELSAQMDVLGTLDES
jgi:hypothetical protein